jgi:hypothetical protein
MTDQTQQTPQAGIAGALHDLSEQSQALARHEIGAAVQEVWQKAKQEAPAVALLAAAGVLGLFAAASSFRLSLRLLERRLSPAAAAFVATAGYGAGAVSAGVIGVRRIRQLPAPVPSETARQASDALADAAQTGPSPAQQAGAP